MKYSTLSTEIKSTYRVQTETIPIVIGALGTVPRRLPGFLKSLGVPDIIGCMQTCAYLGSQRILRNVLSILARYFPVSVRSVFVLYVGLSSQVSCLL